MANIQITGTTRGRTTLVFDQRDIDALADAVLVSIRARRNHLSSGAEFGSREEAVSNGPRERTLWERLTRRVPRG